MAGWHHGLDGYEFEQALGVVKDREVRCAADHGVAKSWTQLSNLACMLTYNCLATCSFC